MYIAELRLGPPKYVKYLTFVLHTFGVQVIIKESEPKDRLYYALVLQSYRDS